MLQKFFSKLLTYNFYLISSNTAQRGQSTAYIIILVIIVIFAVMLSGGGHSLFTGNVPSSITDTPTPGEGQITPSPTTVSWSIEATLLSCDKSNSNDPVALGKMTAKGSEKGYIFIKTIDKSGNSKLHIVTGFDPPQSDFDLKLSKSDEFGSNKWTVELYSGGKIINNSLGGGTLRSTVTKDATNCL